MKFMKFLRQKNIIRILYKFGIIVFHGQIDFMLTKKKYT